MAFAEALPMIAEAGEGAAGGGEGGGMLSKLGSLFKSTPQPGAGEANKQQNVGASRNENFQDAAGAIRGALRGGAD